MLEISRRIVVVTLFNSQSQCDIFFLDGILTDDITFYIIGQHPGFFILQSQNHSKANQFSTLVESRSFGGRWGFYVFLFSLLVHGLPVARGNWCHTC